MKKSKIYLTCACIAAAAMLSACGSIDESVIDTSNTSENSQVSINSQPLTSRKYQKYFDFVLNQSNGDNIVFSSESLNSAFYTYSHLVTEENKNKLNDFLYNVNYLEYENTDQFKSVNRIWINNNHKVSVKDTGVEDLAYFMDMSDSQKATKEKDDYVNKNTYGFIKKTQSQLNNDTVLDVMNVTYFKDVWKDGEKSLDKEVEFTNADGSTTNTKLMTGFKGSAYSTDYAKAFTTEYENGFTITAIVPNDGKIVNDINIDDFIQNKATEVTDMKAVLYLPEFEIESNFECDFSSFGLEDIALDPKVYENSTSTIIYQTAKIKVDTKGTEAAAVTEITKELTAAIDEPEMFEVVCDKPFVYYIQDTKNDDIAFIGILNKL